MILVRRHQTAVVLLGVVAVVIITQIIAGWLGWV